MSSTGTPISGTKTWFLGTGRRKESVARVFLRAGSGSFKVNGRTVEQYFPNHAWKHDAIEPLKFTNLGDQVDVMVTALTVPVALPVVTFFPSRPTAC